VEEEHGCGDPRGNGHCKGIISPSVLIKLTDVQPRFFSWRYIPDDLAVDGTRDTVLKLEVHLGNDVFWEYGGV
jgi:hypothetical protein